MTKDVQFEVVKVRVLWAPQFWRHPILWWKTRPIRRFIRKEAKKRQALPPETQKLMQEMDEKYERAVLFGSED